MCLIDKGLWVLQNKCGLCSEFVVFGPGSVLTVVGAVRLFESACMSS